MTIRVSRAQFIWSPVLGWILMSCATTAAWAQAETPSPAKQTLDQQTPQVDLPDSSASPITSLGGGNGPTGDELGTTVGAFTLFPSLELNTGYDNNVFATAAPTTGSPFEVIRPSIELRSDWLNHSVRLLAAGGFGFYQSAPTQNFQNYTIQFDGRLDIRTDFYLSVVAAFRRSTEALGTPNVSFAQAPTVVDSVPLEVSLYQKFNRFFYQLTGAATRYWYYDYSTITSQGLPGESRDRVEYEERVRLGYELTPALSVFINPAINQRRYIQTLNAAGQDRSSNGWNVGVGSILSLGPKSSLEGSVGLISQTYPGDNITTTTTAFSLVGSWNGYEPLTLRPAINRSINESALSGYQNYISTVVGVDFVYDVHGPWKAVGGLSYSTADYTPVPGTGTNPRTDYFTRASIGALYDFRPQYSIGPLYEYSQGWSSDVAAGGPQYSRNMFSIRLVAKR